MRRALASWRATRDLPLLSRLASATGFAWLVRRELVSLNRRLERVALALDDIEAGVVVLETEIDLARVHYLGDVTG